MLPLFSLQISVFLNKCLSQKAMIGNLWIQNNAFDSLMDDAVTFPLPGEEEVYYICCYMRLSPIVYFDLRCSQQSLNLYKVPWSEHRHFKNMVKLSHTDGRGLISCYSFTQFLVIGMKRGSCTKIIKLSFLVFLLPYSRKYFWCSLL